jgi:hypothetical protein
MIIKIATVVIIDSKIAFFEIRPAKTAQNHHGQQQRQTKSHRCGLGGGKHTRIDAAKDQPGKRQCRRNLNGGAPPLCPLGFWTGRIAPKELRIDDRI